MATNHPRRHYRRPLLFHLSLQFALAFVTAAAAASPGSPSPCPCENTTLCQPIQGQRAKEVYGFRDGDPNNTKYETYDWDVVSTVAWTPVPQLVCHAHARGARVIMAPPNPLPISASDDATARAIWITNTVNQIQSQFLDGVVFDFEGPLLPSDPMNVNYVLLVNETRAALHAAVPGSQVGVCLAWNPHGVDGRYYDNLNLMKAADLAYIMSYDTRSQILGQCIASANAALPATRWGLEEYLTLGADPQKMILGVPWYGYDYTCVGGGKGRRGGNGTTRHFGERGDETGSPALAMMLEMKREEEEEEEWEEEKQEEEEEEGNEEINPLDVNCPIAMVPFRGVGCSDAAGVQVPYSIIQERLVADEGDGSLHQVHYDDAESLRLKYGVARELGLRGVGPYTFDDLPGVGEGGKEGEEAARGMWEALRAFTDEEEEQGKERKGERKRGLRKGGG
ncbi:di-n-acetylchitobiase precursor [Nannochloropsis oceanica]